MSRRSNLKLARLESKVRFGPQQQALAGVLLDIQNSYKQQVHAARGAAAATQQAVAAARPDILKAYATAGQTRQAVQSDIAPFLAQLGTGGSAGIVRAGIGREQALADSHLAQARAQSLGELARRKVQAAAGGAYGVRAAGDQLRQDTLKYAQQVAALAGQKGAFTAATLESLHQADQKLGVQRRGQDITAQNSRRSARTQRARIREQHRHNVAQEHKPRAGLKPKAEPQSSHDFKAMVNDVRSIIRQERAKGQTGHQIRATALASKSVSKRGFRTALNAAMDLEYRGGLSRPNVVALRQAGVRVPRGWLHMPPPKHSPVSVALGNTINALTR